MGTMRLTVPSEVLATLAVLSEEAEVLARAARETAADLIRTQGHALYSPAPGVVVTCRSLSEWDAATGGSPRRR